MTRKVVAVIALAMSLSGCMGRNALSGKALRFNLTTAEGRWTREGLFFGMIVIPVYPIFKLVDLLLFNSIEFWTGTNPLNGKSALVDLPTERLFELGLDNIELAQVERLDEHRANLLIEFENGDRVTFDVVRDQDAYTISYAGVEFFRGSLKL